MLLFAQVQPVKAGVILLYHHVDEHTPAITSIKPEQFERHLSIIEEEGFSVVPLKTLVARSTQKEGMPADKSDEKIVAITFDDAYQSIYTEAFPKLAGRGWPFTIFVAPLYVRDTHPLYLSWAQLKEMSAAGADIQNHTYSHEHLIRYRDGESIDAWKTRVTAEITESAEILADQGFETSQFAYPYGEYNPALLEIVEALELTGFGQQSGAVGPASDLRLLPRYPLAGNYVGEAAFRDKLRSLPMPVKMPDVDPLVEHSMRPELALDFLTDDPPSGMSCFGPGGVMDIEAREPASVVIKSREDLPTGRSRYNCTAPVSTSTGNRYYWFSQLWIKKRADGSWYPEP